MAGQLTSYPVFRFACGHTGRENEAGEAKARAFIRVAELRRAPLREVGKPCPECKRG